MNKFEYLFELNKLLFSLYGSVQTIRRLPLLVKDRDLLRRNVLMKQKRRTDHCYVIGLGPSLKSIDLAKLDGDIIVTNRFYKVPNSESVSPVAYVLCDNDFFTNKYLADFQKAVDSFSDTPFIVNGLYSQEIRKMFPGADNFFYLYLWNGFLRGYKNNIDCCRVLPMSSNVVCTALYVALYMGYKEIYLLGCDFNSFASQKAVHVYEEKNTTRLWTMSTELFQYSFAADLHVQLEKYARKHGQRIYNATDGSLIDAYERVSF